MKNKSKEKGKRVERQIASLLSGKRTYGSDGSSAGLHHSVDIITPFGNFQVKARKKLPKWLELENLYTNKVQGIIIKENNREPLVIVKLKQVKQIKEIQNE